MRTLVCDWLRAFAVHKQLDDSISACDLGGVFDVGGKLRGKFLFPLTVLVLYLRPAYARRLVPLLALGLQIGNLPPRPNTDRRTSIDHDDGRQHAILRNLAAVLAVGLSRRGIGKSKRLRNAARREVGLEQRRHSVGTVLSACPQKPVCCLAVGSGHLHVCRQPHLVIRLY